MKELSTWMMLAIMVVTFIAGYSVVSYAVRKFKEGAGHLPPSDRDRRDPDSASDDTSSPSEFRDRR